MDIVDIYMECGNFHEAVKRSGLPTHIAHLKLLKSGCLAIQDKINYGSKGARLGGEAEQLFKNYVPEAVDANKLFQKNNPVYDFWFDGITIDVKYSSIRKDNRLSELRYFWRFRTTGNQDFICAFLESDADKQLDEPIILLIPMQFIGEQRQFLSVSPSSTWIKDFNVQPEEIQPMLREYADLRKNGLF